MLTLLAVELAVRLVIPSNQLEFVADEDVLWRVRPRQTTYRLESNGRSYVFETIDSDGFRATLTPDATPNRIRILALGDSFTFGQGVADHETFCSQLETISGHNLDVINAGVPGWGVFQEQMRLPRIIGAIRPDFVLVTFVEKDAYRQPFPSEEERRAFLRESRVKNAIRNASKSLTLLGRTVQKLQLFYARKAVPNAQAEKTQEAEGPTDTFKRCLEADLARILSMRDISSAHGARLVIMLWPQATQNTDYFLETMTGFGRQHDIGIINLSDTLAGVSRDQWTLPHDGHPNSLGHKLAARRLFGFFCENLPRLADSSGQRASRPE